MTQILDNFCGHWETTVLFVWANQTPLFGRLDLRNPNSLDLADSLAGFSQSLEIQ